jgi:hypothetical protein
VIIGFHKDWAIAAQREFGKDVITSVDMKIQRDIGCSLHRTTSHPSV